MMMGSNNKLNNTKFRKLIRELTKKKLAAQGFHALGVSIIERDIGGLFQGMYFQSGVGHLVGTFTLNVYWRFEKKKELAFNGYTRIFDLMSSIDGWFSKEIGYVEEEFCRLENIIDTVIMPYLDQHNSLEKLIASCEAGKITKKRAFGGSGWELYYMGLAYFNIGKYKEALREFEELIGQSIERDYEISRKERALSYIEQIHSQL